MTAPRRIGALLVFVGGLGGFLASMIALAYGGLGAALGMPGSGAVSDAGWVRAVLSIGIVLLGVGCWSVRRPRTAVVIAVASLGGVALSGALFAAFMLASAIGAVLVLADRSRA